MFRYGIAGIPLSSKGRTLEDAIKESFRLGLGAIEVQVFRMHIEEEPAIEYAGQRVKDIEDKIIVEVMRPDAEGNYRPIGIDSVLEEDDIIFHLYWNLARNYQHLEALGELAKELDIRLSIHTPYYMDLLGTSSLPEIHQRSLDYVLWTARIGEALQADRVISSIGLYGNLSKKEAMKRAISTVEEIKKMMSGMNIAFSPENVGKRAVFGSFSEIKELCKKTGCPITFNFPDHHARELNTATKQPGYFRSSKDVRKILDELEKLSKDKEIYVHYAGVEHMAGNMLRYLPIKRGDLKFDWIAQAMLEREYNITLISISPLLEHDADYMRVILERYLEKRVTKKITKKESEAKEEKTKKVSKGSKTKSKKTSKKSSSKRK